MPEITADSSVKTKELKEVKNIKGFFNRIEERFNSFLDRSAAFIHDHPVAIKAVMALITTAVGAVTAGVGAIGAGVGFAVLENVLTAAAEKRLKEVEKRKNEEKLAAKDDEKIEGKMREVSRQYSVQLEQEDDKKLQQEMQEIALQHEKQKAQEPNMDELAQEIFKLSAQEIEKLREVVAAINSGESQSNGRFKNAVQKVIQENKEQGSSPVVPHEPSEVKASSQDYDDEGIADIDFAKKSPSTSPHEPEAFKVNVQGITHSQSTV